MQIIFELLRTTWKGAVWYTTALVAGVLAYSDAMHAIEKSQAQGLRNEAMIDEVKGEVKEVKLEFKDDLKEIKTDIKTLLRGSR